MSYDNLDIYAKSLIKLLKLTPSTAAWLEINHQLTQNLPHITAVSKTLDSDPNEFEPFTSVFSLLNFYYIQIYKNNVQNINPQNFETIADYLVKVYEQFRNNSAKEMEIMLKSLVNIPQLFDFFIGKMFDKNMTALLCNGLTSKYVFVKPLMQHLDNHFKDYPHPDKLMRLLLEGAIGNKNAELVQYLKKYQPLFDKTVKSMALPDHQSILLKELATVHYPDLYTKYMLEFSTEFGDITYEGGLLAAADVRNRKLDPKRDAKDIYEYSPVILKDDDEFEELLTSIKEQAPPYEKNSFSVVLTGFQVKYR